MNTMFCSLCHSSGEGGPEARRWVLAAKRVEDRPHPGGLDLGQPVAHHGQVGAGPLTELKASSTQFGESAAQLWRDANLCGKNKQF